MTTAALSPASSDLLTRASEYIPGGVNTCRRRSTPQLCFARGDGAYLWDLEGRRYIDYHAAYGAILLGHSHPAVTERVKLIPNILVLPYRNPFVVAKAAASLDALSDGRFVLAFVAVEPGEPRQVITTELRVP